MSRHSAESRLGRVSRSYSVSLRDDRTRVNTREASERRQSSSIKRSVMLLEGLLRLMSKSAYKLDNSMS